MKTLRGRTLVHLLLVLVIAALTVAGCSDVSGAPTIPSVETFVIPFEDFETSETTGLVFVTESQMQATSLSFPVSEQFSLPSVLSGNQSNWNYAALAVVIWSTIIKVGLAVPVAAFRESFQHTPVQQPDGSWV